MVETHEYGGYWWLPEGDGGIPTDESKRLSGTLTITRGEAELVVLGSFGHDIVGKSETETIYAPAPSDVARINGFTTKGLAMTLEDCVRTDFNLNFPGIPTTTYRPRVVLAGAWFGEAEDISLDEVAIQTSRLETWVGVSGFAQKISGEEQLDTGYFIATGFDIRFEPPSEIPIALDDGDEAKIVFSFKQSNKGAVTTEINFSQSASLHLRFAAPRDLDDVCAAVGQLRNFLSLAVGRSETVLSVTGYRDDLVREGSKTRLPITLLWKVPHNPDPPTRATHPTEMLFTLPQADPSISEVMRAWFARQELFKPVLNLYFGMLYHPDMYSDVRFLMYAQAIETYDFRRRDPYELSRADHKARMAQIREGAPEEWRPWLSERLAGSNFRTLDSRIRDVLSECPTASAKIVGATDDEHDAFVTGFKRSRNYYTHYTPDLERHAVKGVALHLLSVQLRTILEMSLLRELGFSCDAIDDILGRAERYAQIQHFKVLVEEEVNG